MHITDLGNTVLASSFCHHIFHTLSLWFHNFIGRRGVVNRVPAFQPGGQGSIPGGARNFNSYPGIGCVSFMFSPAEALTLCWSHIQGCPPLCMCLVFWSIVSCSPYRHLTHGHLGCKSRGVQVLDWGRVNNWRRRDFIMLKNFLHIIPRTNYQFCAIWSLHGNAVHPD